MYSTRDSLPSPLPSLLLQNNSMKASFITCVATAIASTAAAMASPPAKVDVHVHFLPDFYIDALKEAGHTPGPDGIPSIPSWSPKAQLEFMKAVNIEKAYLSVSSPGVYLTVPSESATQKAITLARKINKYGSQLKAQYPKKLGFFASLPLPDVQAALDEIKYCFHELDPKPDGVVMMSNYYGMYLGDPKLDPVYEALNKLNITIYEHPTTPVTEHNYEKYHNIDSYETPMSQKEWQALNRPVSTRQFATPVLDFPFDTARTFADLFYSEIPSRFKNLKWIISHAGGGLVSTIDRVIEFSSLYNITLTDASMKATLSKSFYFDVAGPWPVNYAIPAWLRWVDHTHFMFGSDTPFTPWAVEAIGARSFDNDLKEVFKDADQAEDVRTGNAKRLLG